MNILYIIRHNGMFSGSPKQLFYLARGMKERGHQVTCVFSHSRRKPCHKETLKDYEQAGIPLDYLNMDKFYNPFAVLELRKKIIKGKYDIIHTYKGGALDIVYMAVTALKNNPIVVAYRGVSFHLSVFNSFKYRSKKLNHIIACSQLIANHLINDHRIPSSKITVIHNTESFTQYNPNVDGNELRRKYHLPEKNSGFVIGLLANHSPWKGHEYLFRGASIFLNQFPSAVIWCVGKGDSSVYQPLLKELGIENKVIFTPFISHFEKAMAACDVIVRASFQGEGISGSLVASMAMKKSLVSSDIGGCNEIITHNHSGLLVPIKDSEALGKAILHILSNPDDAERMITNAHAYYLNHLQTDRMVDKVQAVYHKLLQKTV